VYIPELLVMHSREAALPDESTESGLPPATPHTATGWPEAADSAVLPLPSAAVAGGPESIVSPQHPAVHEIGTGRHPPTQL